MPKSVSKINTREIVRTKEDYSQGAVETSGSNESRHRGMHSRDKMKGRRPSGRRSYSLPVRLIIVTNRKIIE